MSDMAAEKVPSITLPPPTSSGRRVSPSPKGLRQRPLGRASTFAEGHPTLNRRRSSFISETLSDTRRSLRSSTDDIFLPRARDNDDDDDDHDDNSHWQSLPLGLALLPAFGGLFFKNGSAVITDVTLLGLAAIFMNWALRSPWDWYRAAQTPILVDSANPAIFTAIDEVDEDHDPLSVASDGEGRSEEKASPKVTTAKGVETEAAAAQRELRIHEMLALLSCFAFPLVAAWLLHSIRSQLSRPSEGLVSNYNLTIFILVAEIRPISHLIKMVQRRTLFLQRRANVDFLKESSRAEGQQFLDLSHRLNELEAHVADRAADSGKQKSQEIDSGMIVAKASTTATSEVKKTIQPELDALNRAMRRYEKRSTISSVQIEARLQDLETRLNDVVALAAAAQRNADRVPNNYVFILANWICAAFVIPAQYLLYALSLPQKAVASVLAVPKRYFTKKGSKQPPKEGRASRKTASARASDRERRSKVPQ